MTKQKKNQSLHQTKAGLMSKNGDRGDAAKTPAESTDETESTPKMSKDTAEQRETDRPVH